MCGQCSTRIQTGQDLLVGEGDELHDLIKETYLLNTKPEPPTYEEICNAWPVPESARKAILDHVDAMSIPFTNTSCTKDTTNPWILHIPPLSESSIQHPLCRDCAQDCLDHMAARADEVKAEVDTLSLMEREMERLALVDGDLEMSQEDMTRWRREQNSIANKIDSMNEEIQQLKEILDSYDRDHLVLKEKLQSLEAESKGLEEEEKRFWYRYETLRSESDQIASEEAKLHEQIKNEKLILSSLQSSDAYMDAFCIEEDASGMGTINDLRLGRLLQRGPRTDQVEWTEINAALGQVALLITVLGRLMKYSFKEYKVIPRCSISCIETLNPERAMYELYGTNDWQIGRLLHSRRFDHGMVGILTCVKELADFANSIDPNFQLPYSYVAISDA